MASRIRKPYIVVPVLPVTTKLRYFDTADMVAAYLLGQHTDQYIVVKQGPLTTDVVKSANVWALIQALGFNNSEYQHILAAVQSL